jgi:hypothetical protein
MAATAGGLEGKSALDEARQFLVDLLADGTLAQKEIKAAAEGSGLSWATVRRAKDLLGIKPHKLRMDDGWVWELPKVLNSYEGAQASGMSIFRTDEHLRQARTKSVVGIEEFEEWAAIREYDGGFNQRKAEWLGCARLS